MKIKFLFTLILSLFAFGAANAQKAAINIIAKTKRAKVGVTNTNLVHKTNTV